MWVMAGARHEFGIAGNSHSCPSGMGECGGARRGQTVTGASSWSSSSTQSPRFREMRKLPGRRTDSRGYGDSGFLKLVRFVGRPSFRKRIQKDKCNTEHRAWKGAWVSEGPGGEALLPPGNLLRLTWDSSVMAHEPGVPPPRLIIPSRAVPVCSCWSCGLWDSCHTRRPVVHFISRETKGQRGEHASHLTRQQLCHQQGPPCQACRLVTPSTDLY